MSDKIHILAQVGVHIGAHIELASQLGLSVFTVNIVVKNLGKKKNHKRKLQKIRQHTWLH
jgi:uncharacterized alkaline shock family protein YloU